MLPAQLKLLERPIAWFDYKPDCWSLVRVAIWTLLMLLIAGLLLPESQKPAVWRGPVSGQPIQLMLTPSNDPRWVAREPKSFSTSQQKSIAWISGSAGKLISDPPKYVTDYTLGILKSSFALPAEAFLYYMEAARITDVLAATQDALRRRPDFLVIELDPLWIYNSVAVYRASNVFNGAASLWWNANDWPMQFLFVPPRSHAWALVGENLPRVSLMRYSRLLSTLLAQPDSMNAVGTKSSPLLQGIMFWVTERFTPDELKTSFPNGINDVNAWQETAVRASEANADSWASAMADSMFDAIRASGVPTVVFVAPVSREIRDNPENSLPYMEVLTELRRLEAKNATSSLRFITDYTDEEENSIAHYDRIHMLDPGQLPRVLADAIADLQVPNE